ncbi:MAG: hypothetical protein FJ288_03810, partial [Planctomycetes bacterium]|nr:hypothetical protein [Planctomycetota bacterium]
MCRVGWPAWAPCFRAVAKACDHAALGRQAVVQMPGHKTSRSLRLSAPRAEALEPRILLAGEQIVINEIHYDPDVKTEAAEFIELYNAGTEAVLLEGWRFTEGIEYTFGPGASIPAGGYLVVAQDPAALAAKFGVTALGPWDGLLDNDGEKVVLRNAAGAVVDQVDYKLGFPWPTVGDPPGYSIELINPALDNDLGGSWRRSTPEASGVTPATLLAANSSWRYLKGTAAPPAAWLQPGFADGGWSLGTAPIGYGESFVSTTLADMRYISGTQAGYSTLYLRNTFTVADPSQVLTLQLDALYDDGFNVWINGVLALSVNSPPASPTPPAYNALAYQPAGDMNYQSFTLKWPVNYLVAGTNTIAVQLLNTNKGSLDAYFDGCLLAWPSAAHPTPGAQNAAFAANAPPQVRQVDHDPEEPGSNQAVTITAKVTDPDGVQSVTLEYQVVDPGNYIAVEDAAYSTGWTAAAMNDSGAGGDEQAGDNIYTVVLPASIQVNRRLVRYRITAVDNSAQHLSVRVPYADDPQPNFAYFVYDGVPAWSGAIQPGSADPEKAEVVTYGADVMRSLPVYQLLTTHDSVMDAQYGGEAGTNKYLGDLYKWSGTLIYDGVVYDAIHFRARGGVWRYAMGKNMWKFDLNRGHEFQARDDYGRKYDTKWTKLNLGANIQQGNYWHRGEQGLFESVGSRLFDLAGVESFNTNFVQFRVIDDAAEQGPTQYDGDFWGLYLAIEQEDGRFLDEHGLADGNFYKMDGGDADTGPGGGMSNNQGPTQPVDNSDLLAFTNAYKNTTTPPTDEWWRQNLDLESYYSYRAIVDAIHHGDVGYGKNYFYYHDPVTGKWSVHPWDLDLTWADNMYGNGEEPFKKYLLTPVGSQTHAAFIVDYQNRMREIRDLLYNTDQAWQLIDETAAFIHDPGGGLSIVGADRARWDYNPLMVDTRYVNTSKAGQGLFYAGNPPSIVIPAPGGFAGMVQKMKNYVVSRGAWIDANITADGTIPDTPTIAYTGPDGHPVNRLTFHASDYSGTSALAAIEWRIAEVTDPSNPNYDPSAPNVYEINAAWQSGELPEFNPDVTVPGGAAQAGRTYRVRVRMKDFTGRWSHWSDAVQFVAGLPDADPSQALRITELMYHPRDPSPAEGAGTYIDDDFQFIELRNVGFETLDLAGVRFTDGIDFTFPAMSLAPGEGVLVVMNQAAFALRYSTAGLRIAGEFAGGTSLAHGGERLRLESPWSGAILDFSYSDSWYGHTDGEGFSLVVRNASQDAGLWGDKDGWRASMLADGAPGQADPGYNPGTIVISEVLTHQDADDPGDWIEFLNNSPDPVDVGGWYVSDSAADLMKYRIVPGTVIPAGGYLVLTEHDNFGNPADPGCATAFALSELGETVYLTYSPAAGVLGGYREAQDFGAADKDVTFICYVKSTGGKDFVASSAQTRGAANAAPAVGPVVVSEIMYNPAADGDEFIELLNISTQPVLLYDPANPLNTWQFTDGVAFTFPAGASIPAGGYALVVKTDPAAFRTKYGIAPSVEIYGPYSGALDNDGETVELSRPGEPQPGGYVPYVRADRVTYNDAPPWPEWPDGHGPSLIRRAPADYGNDVANWTVGRAGGSPGAANTEADLTPPSVPQGLTAAPASVARIDLAWAASADPETGVARYDVYRNGALVGSSAALSYIDTTEIAPAVTYAYQVLAVNADGIASALGTPAALARIVTLVSADAPTRTSVAVVFTEAVQRDSAETAANYAVTYGSGQSVAVSAATLGADGATVTLTLGAELPFNTTFTLAVHDVLGASGYTLLPGSSKTFTYIPKGTGTILREWWTGLGSGTTITDLKNDTLNFTLPVNGREERTAFEMPTSVTDNYGTRVRGYVTAPQTGNYCFWIASDDNSELWFNAAGEDPAGAVRIAYVPGYTSNKQWSKYSQQKSAAIYLQAGQRYYIEALQKDGTGGDNLAVGWQLPDGAYERPIPASRLSPFFPTPDATITIQATDPNAAEAGRNKGTFTFTRTGNLLPALTVYYTVGGTASAADLQTTLTGSVAFSSGQATVTLDVTPADDTANEADETVILTLLATRPTYGVGASASATVTIADNEFPRATAVRLNGPAGRGASGIEPSGIGVRTVEISFSEAVTFDPADVLVQAVTFPGGVEQVGHAIAVSIGGSGTATMTITLPDGAAMDTWVKVTISGAGTLLDLTGHRFDGEARPGGGDRGYVYSDLTDLPTGDGSAGGNMV